jgi:cytochrome c biogenesis protein
LPQDKKNDPITRAVDFLASVKLSFFIFIILAVASVAGTVIPQKQAAQLYMQAYGQGTGNLILGLGLDDTYHTSWFIFLMAMLAVNLVICSLKRLPTAIKIMTRDPQKDLGRFPNPEQDEQVSGSRDEVIKRAREILGARLGEPLSRDDEGGHILYAQKGAWSRMGVYVVHLSVLIIFVGAIISNIWGLNGTMEINQGDTVSQIVLDNRQSHPLGFGVRLEKYTEIYYEKFKNMPSEFRSDLVFVQNNQDVAKAAVKVNHPFDFGGYTFYQSHRGQRPSQMKLRMTRDGKSLEVELAFRRWSPLPGGGRAGVMEYREMINMGQRYQGPFARILLEDAQGHQHQITAFAPGFKVPKNMAPAHVDTNFEILAAKTVWYTGLQVKKDPGVWWVWIGCGLMVLGFIITFYCSHRKIWIRITPEDQSCRVEIAGSANKNKPALRRITLGLAKAIGEGAGGEEK